MGYPNLCAVTLGVHGHRRRRLRSSRRRPADALGGMASGALPAPRRRRRARRAGAPDDAARAAGGHGLRRTRGDTIGYEDERIERAEQVAALRSLRDVLDERDRRVLYLRFVEDLTQTEIAKRIGVSQMQVSRLIRKALARLSERALGTAA